MGWGQVPSDVKAAEEARAAAIEQAEEADRRRAGRPLSEFERRLLGVLEEIRDAVKPTPLEAIPGAVEIFHTAAGCPQCAVDTALDSPPYVLTGMIRAGAEALAEAIPALREDYTASGFEKFAEIVVEAALHEAARERDGGGQAAAADEAGAGEPHAGPAPAAP